MIDGLTSAAPHFLASVTSPEEARTALSGGADVIDAKDPQSGALGALKAQQIESIVAATASFETGRIPVSATVGDLPSAPDVLVNAARLIAATGVDIVKVGFFGDGDARAAIAALGKAELGRARLFAVLMADRQPDFGLLPKLARAGFAGVMLDTADKAAGALPDVLDTASLRAFVAAAHAAGLRAGLAGSLKRDHIAAMVALAPDIIGFRGALCAGGRTGSLDRAAVAGVRSALDSAIAQLPLVQSSAEKSPQAQMVSASQIPNKRSVA